MNPDDLTLGRRIDMKNVNKLIVIGDEDRVSKASLVSCGQLSAALQTSDLLLVSKYACDQ